MRVNTVSILTNDGNGSFSETATPAVGSQPYSVTTGDLDEDGDLDVITCEESSNLGVIWYENPVK